MRHVEFWHFNELKVWLKSGLELHFEVATSVFELLDAALLALLLQLLRQLLDSISAELILIKADPLPLEQQVIAVVVSLVPGHRHLAH